MPAPFPLLKLGGIILKQISKPIANFAKYRAKSSPFFRTYVCMPPAQFYNWCEIKLKMWVLNLGKPVNIPVLSEAMAIELGANLLGEGIVFTVAAGLLISEYTRSTNKEAAKETARREEVNNLLYQLQELYFRVEQQDAQIREMYRTIVDLDSNKSSKLGGILNLGSKSDSSSDKPSPPPSGPIVLPISMDRSYINSSLHNVEYPENMSLILTAVHMVEQDIVGRDETSIRENSFLTNALLYIEQDVYEGSVLI